MLIGFEYNDCQHSNMLETAKGDLEHTNVQNFDLDQEMCS